MKTKSLKKGKDYIGVGIGALIINKKGKVLIIRRGPTSQNEKGFWGIPGGTVEYGETLEDAAVRETEEELGITVKPLKTLSMLNHIIPEEKQHWVTAAVVSLLIKGTPKIQEPGKIDKTRWINVHDIGGLKLKFSPPALQALLEFKERYAELEDFF